MCRAEEVRGDRREYACYPHHSLISRGISDRLLLLQDGFLNMMATSRPRRKAFKVSEVKDYLLRHWHSLLLGWEKPRELSGVGKPFDIAPYFNKKEEFCQETKPFWQLSDQTETTPFEMLGEGDTWQLEEISHLVGQLHSGDQQARTGRASPGLSPRAGGGGGSPRGRGRGGGKGVALSPASKRQKTAAELSRSVWGQRSGGPYLVAAAAAGGGGDGAGAGGAPAYLPLKQEQQQQLHPGAEDRTSGGEAAASSAEDWTPIDISAPLGGQKVRKAHTARPSGEVRGHVPQSLLSTVSTHQQQNWPLHRASMPTGMNPLAQLLGGFR